MKWLVRYSGITVLVLAVLLLSTRAFARDLDQDEALRLRHEADLRTAAEAQALHQRQMADWQATVAACERGDRARCNAGRQAAAPN